MFFVISGLVIFRAHRDDLGCPEKARSFAWKRFRRIYPLYWICLTLTVWSHRVAVHPLADVVSNYLLMHWFSYQTIMVQAWTLFDEVQFYLIVALCILSKRIGFVVMGAWLALSLVFLAPVGPYWLVLFSPYHLLFGLGIAVEACLEKGIRVPATLLCWLGSIVFAGSLVVAGPYHRGVPVRLTAGVAVACLLLGAADLERQGRLVVPSWLTVLGEGSYSIYLTHFMVISGAARIAYAHWGRQPVSAGVWLLLFVVLGVGVGMATHFAVERPLLQLSGKRFKPLRPA